MTFTLKVLVAGTCRLAEPMTYDRWRQVAPLIEPEVADLVAHNGSVAMVAVPQDSEDNVIHILGRWRQ